MRTNMMARPGYHFSRLLKQVSCAVWFLFSTWACLAGPAGATSAVSPDGRLCALATVRNAPKVPMTELWVMRCDGTGAHLIRRYLGEPGPLTFAPDGALIYLERSLSYPAFGSYLCGGKFLPLTPNRIWRLTPGRWDEQAWPLPNDLDPQAVAVSANGAALEVVDAHGRWRVDTAGTATPLPEDRSAEALFTQKTGSAFEADSASVPPLPVGAADSAAQLHLQEAITWWNQGYLALHHRDFWQARQAWKVAGRAFADLGETRSAGISEGSCAAYAKAVLAQARMTDAELEAFACEDHMHVLGALLAQYACDSGAGKLPDDLDGLFSWTQEKIARRMPDEKTLGRNRDWMRRLFQCLSAENIGYRYCPTAAYGTPILSCFQHRGQILALIAEPDGYRVTHLVFGKKEVDYLYNNSFLRLEAGDTTEGIFLLRAVLLQRPEDADAALRLGQAYLQCKNYDLAKRAFKLAMALHKRSSAPYYGLGLVYMAQPTERYRAIDYFREALIRDRNFVDARYQIARTRYLMKERDTEAEIKKVLEMAPDYADAYLLMGDWLVTVMGDDAQAIVWYARYLSVRPHDAEARRKLGGAYLRLKNYDRVQEVLLDYVAAHPEAVDLLPLVAQACMQQKKFNTAMDFFQAYLSRLSPNERALYEDIRLVASSEELAAFAQTPEAARPAFIERFWKGRDPDLSTPVNERLLEHYRRVWYAHVTFSDAVQPWDRRGEVYIRFGEPDYRTRSQMMTVSQDLAVQRVRERLAVDLYGTAAVGETFSGPVFPVRNFALNRDALGFEKAHAGGAPGTYVDLGFEAAQFIEDPNPSNNATASASAQTPTRAQDARTAGETRAVSARQDIAQTGGDPFAAINAIADKEPIAMSVARPVTGSGEDLGAVAWEAWIYTGIDGGIEIAFTDEFGAGAYDFAPAPAGPEVSVDQRMVFERFSPQRIFETASKIFPDYYAPNAIQPFDFHYALSDFRGANGQSVLEVYLGIPCLPDRYNSDKDETRLTVARYAALIPVAADTVYRQGGDMVYRTAGDQTGPDAMVPDEMRLEVPPGAYRLEVKAIDRLSGREGLYRQMLQVGDYGTGGLRLSGLELAWHVVESEGTGPFEKQGLQVIPMPSRTYRKGQHAFVYYEIYNLVRDAFGQTNYRVAYTILSKADGLSRLVQTLKGGRRSEVGVGYEQRGSADSEGVYTELDLNSVRPGRYTLRVSVTDLNNGTTAARETVFVVAE